ncbi:LAGLIDADG family homing endonuclease [Candidatus Woesearchaeota archaeon]|nr:LAGLIDADG family homing endonuclease [Candidatus Woesearchaeota archaeon]
MNITPEIAELLRALAGDGFIGNYGTRNNQFIVEMTGDNRYEQEYFLYLNAIMQKIEQKQPSVRNPKGNVLTMRYYSKKLFTYFNKQHSFPVGKKEHILVPQEILKSNNLMRHFIRGLLDTDGCVFFDKRKGYTKPYPRLIIYTTSHNLFKEVGSYLQKYFKIHTRIIKRKQSKTSYIIELYGHKQLEQWKKIIGFSNLKHIRKLFASVAQS